jgi:protein-tyrosine kinase
VVRTGVVTDIALNNHKQGFPGDWTMSRTYEALKKAELERTRNTHLKEETLFPSEELSPPEHANLTVEVWPVTDGMSEEKTAEESLAAERQETVADDSISDSSSRPQFELRFADLPPTVEEQYQRLYTSLVIRSQLNEPIQTIMVVGVHHGDGVTTSASLFARALAKSRTVLLVDANLRTPALAEIFHTCQNRGFAEFLARKVTLEGAISPTDIPGLFLMTSGAALLAPPHLFANGNFDQLLADLKEKFDCIIFDAAPLATHLDSMFLASRVDGVLLVIKAEVTQVTIGLEVKKLLDEVGARILGAVVNQPQDYVPQFFRRFIA